jgi:hypothetical protein
MNTVEKNSHEVLMEIIDTVSYAALKISELNNETYRHFVINIEEILDQQEKVLEINESKPSELGCVVLDNDGKFVVKQFLASKVTFQISDQIDFETLMANLRFTLKELLIKNEGDDQFCFSISVKDSKFNIADIADYLADQTFLNFNFFYNEENDALTMFSHEMLPYAK